MKIEELLSGMKRVAVFGHVRPDGDCVGSTLGMYNYMTENFPDIKADIYLESFSKSFLFLKNADKIRPEYQDSEEYDGCIVLDCAAVDRIGANGAACLERAKKTVCLDHHISNKGFAQINLIYPSVSSASEVLYYCLEPSKISKETAECLYMGIVHDTGILKFSCTGKNTLLAAANLVEKGIDFPRIINDTYLTRTYNQTRVTGKVMMECQKALDGKVVYGYLKQSDMDKYGVGTIEMDGIIDCLREVEGCEVAIFLYQIGDTYKVSMRSQYYVNVSEIAVGFGGGGHVRAAGCSVKGEPEEIVERLLERIKEQLIGDK